MEYVDQKLNFFTSPTKEVVPTDLFRAKIRKYTRAQRENQRENATDALRFGLGEIQAKIQELDNLTEKDVSGIAARIKRRKHATVEDCYRLSHAFLQDEQNIRAFAMITGAAQVLVKELTGRDYLRQLSAAECFCNFALGEAPVCEKIVNLAGSYLVTYLDSSDARLKRSCLWTISNLLATEGKAAQTLLHMALIPKLWLLYTNGQIAGEDYQEDAAICLHLIALRAGELLAADDVEFIIQHLSDKLPASVGSQYHLELIWHCGIICPERTLSEPNLEYLIRFALSNLCRTNSLDRFEERLSLLYAVRVLANLLPTAPKAYALIKTLLVEIAPTSSLVSLLCKLFNFQNETLNYEVAWFLKNIMHCEPKKEKLEIELMRQLQL